MAVPIHTIKNWHIYVCPHCNASDPPKDKYVVVVCKKKDEAWGFFINSEIPRFIKMNPALISSQVSISPNDYGFLDHESFIGCNDLKKFFAWELKPRKAKLKTETIDTILEAVKISPTLDPEQQQAILASRGDE